MDEKLMIGTELFEYISDLTDVAAELLAAKSVAEEMLTILQGEDTYEGKAREILITYTQSLSAHLERLYLFYEKAASYVYNTFESMYQSDLAMANFILNKMGEDQVIAE
jgi:hypothetical protein